MKVTSSPNEASFLRSGSAATTSNSSASTQARQPAHNEGPLSQLKNRNSPGRDNGSPVRAALPDSDPSFGARGHHHTSRHHGSSHSHRSQQPAPPQTTPFHAGTQNDCGLHTIAAMTGWSEQQVVQSLGLTQQQVQHISAYGMQPHEFTAALNHLNGPNNGTVHHRQGSPRSLAASLPQLQDGGQFALGIERNAGIGHLVSAQRMGNQLVVTDRQSGQRHVFNTEQDLQNYLAQSGVARVHTWYNQ